MPDSDFCTLPTDNDYDTHELVYNDVTLRLKFNATHDTSTPITTEFTAITIAVPTPQAYRQRTQNALNELE